MSYKLLVKIRDTKESKEHCAMHEFDKKEEATQEMENIRKMLADPALVLFTFVTEEKETILIPGPKFKNDCIVTFYTSS